MVSQLDNKRNIEHTANIMISFLTDPDLGDKIILLTQYLIPSLGIFLYLEVVECIFNEDF